MLNVQIQEMKKEWYFKGADLIARVLIDDLGSYSVYFTCSHNQQDYLLTTQTNKIRKFKSLDTIFSVIRDLQLFNDLNISSLRIKL
jgi:hypothetical protein